MRLFSRISLILLAVLFAWRLGPAFISGLVFLFPAFGDFVKWLFPSVQGRSAMEWFEFVVAIFLFWFLFKAAGVALGFMVPQAQLFGTTKALRRFQGLCGEGFIIVGLFMGVTLVDAMMRERPLTPQEREEKQEQLRIDARREFERENRVKNEERQKKAAEDERIEASLRAEWKSRRPFHSGRRESNISDQDWDLIWQEWMAAKPSGITPEDWQGRWSPYLIKEWDAKRPYDKSQMDWYRERIACMKGMPQNIGEGEWQKGCLEILPIPKLGR